MEEEEPWKEMSLPASTPAATIFQYSPAAASYRDHAVYLATASVVPLPPPPRAATALTLTFAASTSSGDDSLHMPGPFAFPSFPNNSNNNLKVAAVQPGSGDRRQRRLIKIRELGARSRARKQEYANELEQELAQLKRENHMLVKRVEDLHARLATAAQVPADKPTLQRCRSAPAP